MYSMTVTLSDTYVDFFTLGRAVLRMTADVHGLQISDEDVAALATAMRTMPAHPDVADGLAALREQRLGRSNGQLRRRERGLSMCCRRWWWRN